MELQRRTGHGRLAELFGEIALDTIVLRAMGFGRLAERELSQLSEPGRAVIEAYVQGVNALIQGRARSSSHCCACARAWQPVYVLVWWHKMLAQNLARGWITQALRARIAWPAAPSARRCSSPESIRRTTR